MQRFYINQIDIFYDNIGNFYIFAMQNLKLYLEKLMIINLTTLKYIVALDTHRNFVKAAEACSVTQPTLSTSIKNMESDLDIIIFDRSSHPVKPTLLGEKIIAMARKTISSASLIEEFVAGTRGEESGDLALGIIPTVAPYILPDFFKKMGTDHPGIRLTVEEIRTEPAIRKLLNAELDAVIMATPLGTDRLLEIPVYREPFIAYVSPSDELSAYDAIPADMLATERIWLLEEGHCLRNQVLNLCSMRDKVKRHYQAGSVATLVKIVDKNGGYTVIPQLHAELLCEKQKKNLRPITGKTTDRNALECQNCIPNREISLVIREDYIRERMLNIIADAIKSIIPEEMLDERLKKFTIKI